MGVNYIFTTKRWRIYCLPLSSPSVMVQFFSPPLSLLLLLFAVKVRLLDGSTITTVFKALEPLAAVRVYVQMNSNTPESQDFTLLSPYPRQVYTEMDMEKPLKELGEHWTNNSSIEQSTAGSSTCSQCALTI